MRWYDLEVLVPDIYKKISDVLHILMSENEEFKGTLTDIENVRKNMHVQTCDLETLIQWENILNLKPEGSLEKRRTKVLAELMGNELFTRNMLESIIEGLIGSEGWRLIIETGRSMTFEMKKAFEQNVLNYLFDLIEHRKPAHIEFAYEQVIPVFAHVLDEKAYASGTPEETANTRRFSLVGTEIENPLLNIAYVETNCFFSIPSWRMFGSNRNMIMLTPKNIGAWAAGDYVFSYGGVYALNGESVVKTGRVTVSNATTSGTFGVMTGGTSPLLPAGSYPTAIFGEMTPQGLLAFGIPVPKDMIASTPEQTTIRWNTANGMTKLARALGLSCRPVVGTNRFRTAHFENGNAVINDVRCLFANGFYRVEDDWDVSPDPAYRAGDVTTPAIPYEGLVTFRKGSGATLVSGLRLSIDGAERYIVADEVSDGFLSLETLAELGYSKV